MNMKMNSLKAIGNVCGHSIGSYQIHSGKSFYVYSKYTSLNLKKSKNKRR